VLHERPFNVREPQTRIARSMIELDSWYRADL